MSRLWCNAAAAQYAEWSSDQINSYRDGDGLVLMSRSGWSSQGWAGLII